MQIYEQRKILICGLWNDLIHYYLASLHSSFVYPA